MRAGHADARLVVAVDVGAHVEFEFVLLRIQQLPDLLGIADRIDAARDGARDRAGLDPPAVGAHEHFRRGRHQEFAVAEIHQRAIGRRIDPAQPLEHFRRRALAGFGEQLPRHRLEQIAARKRGARGLDRGLIFAGRVIGKSLPRRLRVDAFGGLARQALRWTCPSRQNRSSAPRRARWRGHRPAGDPARRARCRAGRSRARASARGPRSGTPDRRRRRRTGRAADRHWRRTPRRDRAPATSRWRGGCAGLRRPAPRRAGYGRRDASGFSP